MSKRGGIRSRHRKALEPERDRVSPEQLREVMRVLGEKACFIGNIGGTIATHYVDPSATAPLPPVENGRDDSRTGLPSDSATSQNGPTSGASRSNVDRTVETQSTDANQQ